MAKPPVVQWVEDNYPSTECAIYSGVKGAAITAAVASAFTGNVPGVIAAGSVALAADFTSEIAGCGNPPDLPAVDPLSVGNCWKGTADGQLQYFNEKLGLWYDVGLPNATEVLYITQGPYVAQLGTWQFEGEYTYENGEGRAPLNFVDGGNPVQVRITGRPCADEVPPEPWVPGLPIGEPFTPTPPDGCDWKCTPIDAYVDASGVMRYYVLCTASDPATCGGPFGYWTGGGKEGPDWVNPFPPEGVDDDGNPVTPSPLPPTDNPNIPGEDPRAIDGTTYRLDSVCEVDSNGQPVQESVIESIPASSAFDAIVARLDAIVPLLQGQKDFKQPICQPAKASGDLRTISFRSEQVSPNGKSCLRKRLRYRSVSGVGLDGLVDHWKDFSFEAGPVIVKHIGSSLGTLTVWAASIDEGKRVILHAFGEAGVDANQAGRWEICSSTSTRFGMPGTMNIDTTGGFYWITCRDGSNNRPIVVKA